MEALLVKPAEAFKMLNVSRSKGYAMLMSGEIPSIRIGRAVRVPMVKLREWIEQRLDEQASKTDCS